MRRFITQITDTITTVFGIRPGGIVVTGIATLRLRALDLARSFLARLSGRTPAYVPVAATRPLHSAGADRSASRLPGHHHGPNMAWLRGCRRPVQRGATTREF
ncbi:MAG TPA: hypothetical protein VMY42_19060 [Thermoguttaceae bacterium]|nr:hypothetical protein [Thermoguttaceae bacterium]